MTNSLKDMIAFVVSVVIIVALVFVFMNVFEARECLQWSQQPDPDGGYYQWQIDQCNYHDVQL